MHRPPARCHRRRAGRGPRPARLVALAARPTGPRCCPAMSRARLSICPRPSSGTVTEGRRCDAATGCARASRCSQIDPGVAGRPDRPGRGRALAPPRPQARDAAKGQRPAELAIFAAQRAAARAQAREAELAYGRVATLYRQGIYAAGAARPGPGRPRHRRARSCARPSAASTSPNWAARRPGRRRRRPRRPGRRRAGRGRDPRPPARAARARRRPDRGGLLPARRVGGGQPAGRRPAARRPGQAALLRAARREVAAYRPGASGALHLRRLREGLQAATVAYVSPRPEFTPPVIYSRESRDRLVFLVEARPDRPRRPDARPAGRRHARCRAARR